MTRLPGKLDAGWRILHYNYSVTAQQFVEGVAIMATTEVTIWEMILRPHFGEMSPRTAKTILDMGIPETERARMKALLAKAKLGTISPDESLDLNEYERAGNILSILKAKARRVVSRNN
jgi:hypothetical protein